MWKVRFVFTSGLLALVGASGLVAVASAQPTPSAAVLSRVSSAYRAAQTFRASGTLTRKFGQKELTGTVSLAAERPNKYLLEVRGDRLNTLIVSDGTTLVASRTDRKIYTRGRTPARLMQSDIIGPVDIPSPGARIITLLLSGRLRDPQVPLARSLAAAKVAEGVYAGEPAYVLTFAYGDDYTGRVTVTAADSLIRRVDVLQGSKPYVAEIYSEVEVDRPLPAGTFARSLPEGSLLVSVLPALDLVASSSPTAPDFTLKTADGGSVTLSKLRGKVVLLNFFFVT